jgi:hypothetical protein
MQRRNDVGRSRVPDLSIGPADDAEAPRRQRAVGVRWSMLRCRAGPVASSECGPSGEMTAGGPRRADVAIVGEHSELPPAAGAHVDVWESAFVSCSPEYRGPLHRDRLT